MTAYKHGVYITEIPTSIVPPRSVESALPFIIGTAPVHKLESGIGPVNEPKLCYTYSEVVRTFGYDADWEKFTLCEVFKAYFSLFNVGPMVVVNVFDPAGEHKASVDTPESKAFDADGEITLDHDGLIDGSEEIQPDGGGTPFVNGTDYDVDYINGIITRIADGGITAGSTVQITYDYGDPSLVADADIVGGVDGSTGALTGLELVGRVFPRFRMVPAMILAPGWSHVPGTAAVMAAKADDINGHFRGIALIDLPETVTNYTDAPSYKNTNNLTDELQVLCWPRIKLDDATYWMSSQLGALMAQVDGDHDSVPYKSPSNENLQMNSAVAGGAEIWLDPQQAAYLNGQGIITALNFEGGWKLWGNRTAAYPANTDVKDSFLPIRRMFNWVSTNLVLTSWQFVDYPIRRRFVDTILDTFNIWLNGLTAKEYILGGRVEFLESENPTTDLMDGIIRFHCYVTPPSPAREIGFYVEYDPAYIQTLFGQEVSRDQSSP